MSDLTPADLVKFVHPVPLGATIPAGTPYAYRAVAQIGIRSHGMPYESTQVDASVSRWTAEPLTAPKPEPTLPERAHSLAEEAIPGSYWHRVTVLVAELVEKVEAQS